MSIKPSSRWRIPRHYLNALAPIVDISYAKKNEKQTDYTWLKDKTDDSLKVKPINQQQAEIKNEKSLTPIDVIEKKNMIEINHSRRNFIKPPPKPFYNCQRISLLTIILLLLIASLVTSIVLIVLYTTRESLESNYGESCLYKQCNKSKLLNCIDGICQCNDFEQQYHNKAINGCETKTILERMHGEYCLIGTTICLNNSLCIDSVCKCNTTTSYWNGTTCLNKKSYNSICINRNTTILNPYYLSMNCINDDECYECSKNSLLECNVITNTCNCLSNNNYYYDTTFQKCIEKKSYFSYCINNLECDSTIGLYCLNSGSNCPITSLNNRCDCQYNYYYDSDLKKCNLKKNYYRPCTVDCECDTINKGLNCFNNYCTCPQYSWYNGIKCVPQNTYGTSCTNHIECRGDLGLTCFNSTICTCNRPESHYWSSTSKKCIECPEDWVLLFVSSTWKCYLFSTYSTSYSIASSTCIQYGAKLIEFSSATELNAILSQTSQWITLYWIGYYGTWDSVNLVWSSWNFNSNNVVAVTSFFTFSPISNNPSAPYVALSMSTGFISNWPNSQPFPFICEI